MQSKIAEPVTRSLPTYPTMPHMHLKIDAPTALTNPQMVRALVRQVDTPPPPPILGLQWAGHPGCSENALTAETPFDFSKPLSRIFMSRRRSPIGPG